MPSAEESEPVMRSEFGLTVLVSLCGSDAQYVPKSKDASEPSQGASATSGTAGGIKGGVDLGIDLGYLGPSRLEGGEAVQWGAAAAAHRLG